MTTVISVDLAFKHYSDIGIVVVQRSGSAVVISPVRFSDVGIRGKPHARLVSEFLVSLADQLGADVIGLDGPQGWKDSDNGYQHSRTCEALLHTQGKTGPPGTTKPAGYLGFIEFSIATFDALAMLGWPRFSSAREAQKVAVETFPTAAWRSVGLKPLPGKAKSSVDQIEDWSQLLLSLGVIKLSDRLSHDELSAAISGIGLLALAERMPSGFEAVGTVPFEREGLWFEGHIVNPRSATAPQSAATLI